MSKYLRSYFVMILTLLLMTLSIAGCSSKQSSDSKPEAKSVEVTEELNIELDEQQEAEGK